MAALVGPTFTVTVATLGSSTFTVVFNNTAGATGTGTYFPTGIPANPVDGSAYTLSATTHRVN